MRKPSIGVSLEGLPCMGLGCLLTLALALLGWTSWAVLAFVLTALVVNFFRDPERVAPAGPGLAVAPADGKVVRVGPAPNSAQDTATGQERIVISIFMNVLNVHVNRSPVQGQVQGLAYHAGTFLNASLDKASKDNERNEVHLADAQGQTWTVVQIAGLIARRIVCWAEQGDVLARGQRFGLIKFGSRLDLYLPETWYPVVTLGQKTVAGQTVVARQLPEAAQEADAAPFEAAPPAETPPAQAPAPKTSAPKTSAPKTSAKKTASPGASGKARAKGK